LSASDHDRFAALIRQRVDLLMWHVRRHVDEISGAGLLAELQPVTPPHSRPPPNNIEDGLKLAVVMGTCLCVWLDHDSSRPQLARAGAGVSDRRRPGHARSLWRIEIQVSRPHNLN